MQPPKYNKMRFTVVDNNSGKINNNYEMHEKWNVRRKLQPLITQPLTLRRYHLPLSINIHFLNAKIV